eukprot:Gregarina_sp_Poly_1__3332@NODE_195_length_11596_cov_85_481395_g174_i0_p7_GENE_NODE_195_length_11596_cov_85_481395_g174_i0NODE_195_length_11596_cov_85_481395_g174_i0_p7_ORF_typecomplete_len172_score16_35Peptidase_M14/PF00246_24/0_011_NODE_195_length_11596_cov_85_481395_g174_i01044110956
MRSLTYNWGGPNHLDDSEPKTVSTESPDDACQTALASKMQRAAGPYHRITDIKRANVTLLDLALQAEHATLPLGADDILNLGIQSIPEGLFPTWFYSTARTSSLVYPVQGGVEDWTYGGGWEPRPDPIGLCVPSHFVNQGDPQADPHLKFPFFLAETDDNKHPPTMSYGSS